MTEQRTGEQKDQGCYQCGSDSGTLLKLCPACQEQAEKERQNLKARITVDTTGIEDPFVYKVTNIDNANWLLVAALFSTLLIGAGVATFALGIAFSVTFLLFTALLSLGLLVVSQVALVREAYAVAPWMGVACTLMPPLCALLMFIPREKFEDPAVLISIKTTTGAFIVGGILLVSSFVAANLIGVKLLKPATYWRIAASFEDTTPKKIAPFARHFE
jgi:hypothetical protein